MKKRFQTVSFLSQGLDAILEGIPYNRSYLCKAFKKRYGVTMSEYLLRAWLVLARHNLLFSTENVTNIALSCGFSSTSYFNKTFKKYYGVTPLKLRKSK